MVRMLELHRSIPGIRTKDDVQQGTDETRSDRLATAGSTEERRAIHEEQVESKEFADDCKAVAKLLQANDRAGLVTHGTRHIPERAAARAAAIRSGG
jgi:hypothetical protein